MSRFILLTLILVAWDGVVGQEQQQPAGAGSVPGGAGGARGGRGGVVRPPFSGPAFSTQESTSRGSAGTMMRPMPAGQPMPMKIGKPLSFEVLLAARKEAVESATAEKILELEKAGKLDYVNRMQVTTLEDLPAFVQFGASVARTSGRTATNTRTMPIYSDINLGSILQVTARIAEEDVIVAQIYVEQSFLDGGAEGPFDPQDNRPPKSIEKQLAQTTVRLKPGEPVMIGGHQTAEGKDAVQRWIVVTGRVGN